MKRPTSAIMRLDPDAVEAACLGHDLGHPPFGHTAETELDQLARDWVGLEGNAQSFRILTRLAVRELHYPGLNLARTTLNGVLKYPWLQDTTNPAKTKKWGAYASEKEIFDWVREDSEPDRPSLEAEIMDWADDVTYATHDLEDFYRVGLVPLDLLTRDSQELGRFRASLFSDDAETMPAEKFARDGFTKNQLEQAVDFLFGQDGLVAADRYRGTLLDRVTTRARSSALIDRYIGAVTIRKSPDPKRSAIVIDPRFRVEVAVLKELTWFYVIKRPSLATMHQGQSRVIGIYTASM